MHGNLSASTLELRHFFTQEGFGNLLAEGSFKAAQVLGKGSERFSFHVKGRDLIEGISSCRARHWVASYPRAVLPIQGAFPTANTASGSQKKAKRPLALKWPEIQPPMLARQM